MIEFTVNGRRRTYRGPAFKRLLDVLREEFRLTGTKEGCGEGECGACTVLLGGRPVNSCLIPVAQVAGQQVETIEGIGPNGELDRVQAAFLREGAAQCGICTPGMVLCATAWVRQGGGTNPEEIRRFLAGNLCRCTGYQHIVNAVVRTVEDGDTTGRWKEQSANGGRKRGANGGRKSSRTAGEKR
ncbi:MAG: (2Fe-2S)-binding protein [Candidatus Eisenbacteria bacterium]